MKRAGALLVRVDSDPASGAGHAMRCLALAQAWQDAGGTVHMAMASGAAPLGSRLAAETIAVEPVAAQAGSAADAAWTAALARRLQARWVVLDGYWVGPSYQRSLHGAGLRVLVIDDTGKLGPYAADVILNQNLHATDAPYRDGGSAAALLLGPRFALLRRELRGGPASVRETPAIARRILVTLGGSDPAQATERVVRALRPRAAAFELRILAGPANARAEAISKEAAAFGPRAEVCRAVEDVAPLLEWADLAVSAAGSTSWELCRFGVPFVTIAIADNQVPIADSLERAGVSRNAGWHAGLDEDRLSALVAELAGDAGARRRMSEAGRGLVDGRGAERVVDRLQEERAA